MKHVPSRLIPALRALIVAVCTTDVVRAGLVDAVAGEIDLVLGSMPRRVRVPWLAALGAIEISSLLTHRRPFSHLGDDIAAAHLTALHESPAWAGPLKIVRGVVAFSYYEMPQVQRGIGYDPDTWIQEVSQKRAARFAADVAAHEDRLRRPNPLIPLGRSPRDRD